MYSSATVSRTGYRWGVQRKRKLLKAKASGDSIAERLDCLSRWQIYRRKPPAAWMVWPLTHAGVVGGEEDGGGGDVLGLTDAAERRLRLDLLAEVACR